MQGQPVCFEGGTFPNSLAHMPACPLGTSVFSHGGSFQNSRPHEVVHTGAEFLFKIVPHRVQPRPSEFASKNASSVGWTHRTKSGEGHPSCADLHPIWKVVSTCLYSANNNHEFFKVLISSWLKTQVPHLSQAQTNFGI